MRHPLGSALPLTLALALPVLASEVPPGRWQEVGARDAVAWAGLAARYGPGWSAWVDTATGAPSMILGPAIPLGAGVRADDAGVARARALLEELREPLRIDDPSAFALERAVAFRNADGQDLVAINFKQTARGLDVWHEAPGGVREKLALVKVRINATRAVVTMLGSDAVPGLELPPGEALDEEGAARRALEALGDRASTVGSLRTRSYVSVRAEGAFVAREARVATAVPPHAWRVVFDAHTGRLVETRDELRHADVIGNVSAGVLDYPGGAFQVLPARSLRVSVVNTLETGFTDAVGDFQIPHMGTSPVALTGRFLGVWAVVNDQSGNGNLSFTLSATPGLVRNVFLNPLSGAEYETAEASAYHWTTTTRWALAGPLPSFTGLASLPVNVNLANTCNAYWNGSSINFFRSGGGCPNSATEDIVAHEYGHGFHDWFHGSTSPGGFSEGIGDHVAYYRTGSREVGRGFFGPGSRLRDYRPGGAAALTQWPCTNCEVHLRGQIWAGFTMDLKDSLVASWTPFPAQVYWNLLTITMYGTNPADEVEALTEAYLIDDNDAFLSNGTPRCRDLTWAARRHSLPVPWQIPVSCGADPHPAAPEFRAPVLETELSRSMFDASPALSDDQLEIWFVSSRTGGLGRWDVWTAARPSIAAPWSGLVPLTAVNSSADELGVAVAPDRRSLFIATNRAGGSGGYDIWMSFRWSTSDPWPAPIPMPTLNTASDELDPSMAGDGLELFFASNRPPSSGFGIWSATRSLPTAFVWNPARRHYDNFRDERSPVVSHDGTRLFFTYPDGSGQTDFFESRRTASSFTFAALGRELTEVNSSRVESRGDLTADGFSFYLTRESLGDVDIYRADRIQPVLNGTRHAAAGQPVTLSLRRDAGDFGHIVLAVDPLPPTPIGGVVGDLLIVPLVTVASGVHNPNGVVTWNTAAANAPGVFLYFQGISQDPVGQWYLSDRLTFLHR